MEKKIDLRIQKTYSALHNAFTQLLSQKLLEDITVNELCDAAEIRRTTFYKHFSDKFDYFTYYMDECFQEFRENVPYDLAIEDPIAYLTKRLQDEFIFIRNHSKLVNHLKNSTMFSFLYHSFQKQLEIDLEYAFINIGKQKKTPELDLMISFYSGAFINLIGWQLEHPDTFSEKEIASLVVNALTTWQL